MNWILLIVVMSSGSYTSSTVEMETIDFPSHKSCNVAAQAIGDDLNRRSRIVHTYCIERGE